MLAACHGDCQGNRAGPRPGNLAPIRPVLLLANKYYAAARSEYCENNGRHRPPRPANRQAPKRDRLTAQLALLAVLGSRNAQAAAAAAAEHRCAADNTLSGDGTSAPGSPAFVNLSPHELRSPSRMKTLTPTLSQRERGLVFVGVRTEMPHLGRSPQNSRPEQRKLDLRNDLGRRTPLPERARPGSKIHVYLLFGVLYSVAGRALYFCKGDFRRPVQESPTRRVGRIAATGMVACRAAIRITMRSPPQTRQMVGSCHREGLLRGLLQEVRSCRTS